MANDPVLSESVIAQSVAPSCSVRNFVSDEAGRILMVPASSAPLNVAVPASTAPISLTTGNVITLTTTSVISYSSVPTVTLTSGSLTLGLLSTAQVITTTTTSTIGLTTTSVVGLTTTAIITQSSGAVIVSASSSPANIVQLTSDSNAVPLFPSTLGSITTVALTSSTAAQAVLNANAARKGFVIQNRASASVAYIALASTAVIASTANFSFSIAAQAVFQWTGPGMFTGGITGCANLLAGSTLSVTELT